MMNDVTTLRASALSEYAALAHEYYDSSRHPTCASLRELSVKYLASRLQLLVGNERVLETGAGRSIAAPTFSRLGLDLSKITLLDNSVEMLDYSAEWERLGARLLVAEAERTGLPAGSIDVIVSSLGDPYNTASFWQEVARLLRSGGICHFTTPASEWAFKFRAAEFRSVAEFVSADGTILLMPSPVFTGEEQARMFSDAGLKLVETASLGILDLQSAPAPKLLCISDTEPVVRGYSVRRV